MFLEYLLFFLISLSIAYLITPYVIFFAKKNNIFDVPNQNRKIHQEPTPLLGGIVIFIAFFFSIFWYLKNGNVNYDLVPKSFFYAIFIGSLFLLIGGYLDDKLNLPPKILWIFPALACLVIVVSGIGVGIKQISNPFGGFISIDYNLKIFTATISLSSILVWTYLMGMIFTTKFLDGLDGLCTGISLIGGMTLFLLSLTEKINQPITATIAIMFCGSLLGFLFYNFNPAKIFLGEIGSTLSGFILGILSIILGGKIATVLLVMGIPILDVAWAIIRRLFYGQSPFKADRTHLHHRLLDIDLTQKQAVAVLWSISGFFGILAIFLQSFGKLIALTSVFLTMLILAIIIVILFKKRHPHIPETIGIDEKSKN